MTTTGENHPKTFLVLIMIIIAIGTLGFTSLKNTHNPTSSIVYMSPTPVPTDTPPKPTIRQISTNEAEMTVQEAEQQKPGPPSGLTIIQVPDGLQLQWRAILGGIKNYTIYRSEGTGQPQKIESKNAQKETELQTNGHYDFIDTTVQNGISYAYSVSATNTFNTESNSSETVKVQYETLIVE